MKEVVFLSGKGGTGKTSVVASVASLARDKVMVDCDVDAADLHLILKPVNQEKHQFWSGQVASIDSSKCFQCGLCATLCRFEAIEGFYIDPVSCEGCGLCVRLCPFKAINEHDNLSGHWFISETSYGKMVHARLGIAEENTGKLVALVREKARAIAKADGHNLIISDGPPGIGCPVISSLSGVDLAVIITEPTLSGIYDLERVLGVCRHFGVRPLVCINKYDLNEDNTRGIENYCQEQGVEAIGRIPFDIVVTEAMVHGLPVVEYSQGRVSQEIANLWQSVERVIALE